MFRFTSYIIITLAASGVRVLGLGIALTLDEVDIKSAIKTNSLDQLFAHFVAEFTLVMFTSSECTISDASKALMNEKLPDYSYYYYDYDTQPLGNKFIIQSAKAANSKNLPQVWVCGHYIGGYIELKKTIADNSLLASLNDCSKFNLVNT